MVRSTHEWLCHRGIGRVHGTSAAEALKAHRRLIPTEAQHFTANRSGFITFSQAARNSATTMAALSLWAYTTAMARSWELEFAGRHPGL
jgi:hypothetical protein